MNWTEQQKDAIDARNSSIIVSAAAGSGKTAVLTERLVQLLADPGSGVRGDRLIVVTFTNDAAAEMKGRLDSKLRSMINTAEDKSYLLKQQVLLQSAKISTINSFCFELLRDNITDQGITSGFGVLEDTDLKIIQAKAMEELFDYYSEYEYEKISYLYDRFCLNEQQPLENAIIAVDNFLCSVTIGEEWLDKIIAEYRKPFCESVYYNALFESKLNDIQLAVQLAEDNFKALNDIFPDQSTKQAKENYEQAAVDLERAETLLRLAERHEIPSDAERNFIVGFETMKPARGNYNKAARALFTERRKTFKSILQNAAPAFCSAEADYLECGEVTELLAEAVRKFRQLVWEQKCEKNAISFDDGERLALELLMAYDENGNICQSEVAKRTAEQYDIIMIDEYQDSSNKEDLIFKLLSKNYKLDKNGEPMYGDNAFVVGDVKQSIYGFRLANPENFVYVRSISEPYSSDSRSSNKAITLGKNFRSSREVIDFVNFIFTGIMTRDCGDIDYNGDECLYYGADQYSQPHNDDRRAQLNLIDADAIAEESGETSKSYSPEAEVTAGIIAEMLRKGYPVVQSDGSIRPCEPKDFSILVRKNNLAKAYAEAIEKRGIQAKGTEEKGYLRSQEIAVLTDLLRIIANPLQDVPMAAVLVSPMYEFRNSDLAYIKMFGKKTPFYVTMKSAAEGSIDGFDPIIASRCRVFLEDIDRFRLNSVTMSIGELISCIYDDTDYIAVMQQYSDGEKKRANLRMLIQYAAGYEKNAASYGSGGLSGFLRHIDRILESGDYEQGKVAAASGNYVTVQTLHGSKGLEYPFVFIAETSVGFKFDDKAVACSDDGRIGYVLYDKKIFRKYRTFQQTLLTEEQALATRSEEMRLLYVGLTRAKQKLFVNLNCGERAMKQALSLVDECVVNGGRIKELVSKAKCFADWFWLCMMTQADFPEILDELGLYSGEFGLPAPDRDDEVFTFRVFREQQSEESAESEEEAAAEADDELVNELLELIHSDYDRTYSEIAAKLSVTQIAKKEAETQPFDLTLSRPRFISESGKMTGAERGTAIHTFFQYCSFENAIDDPAAEIERLRQLGYLTAAQADSIPVEKITPFFGSSVYRKLMSAKSYQRELKFTVAAAELDIDDEIVKKFMGTDVMIKGIVDLMYEEEDGIVIVDYKSDRGVSANALRERYRKQLEIYKAALELTTGKRVKGLSLYSIELEQEIVI
ncbi:MAG: UvrD-helicase domain-containing protein [Alistipes sp.]|nr:UvrD-helicase domain-containing protein [Alistipes sp.]